MKAHGSGYAKTKTKTPCDEVANHKTTRLGGLSLSQKLFYFLGKPHLAWVSLFEVYRLQIHPSCAFERPEISHTAVCDQRLLALGTIGLFLKKETQKLLIGFIYKLRPPVWVVLMLLYAEQNFRRQC